MIKKFILVPLLKVLGVNADHFFALYSIKMKMDFRRTPNSLQTSGKKQTFGKQIFLYGLIGLMMLPMMFTLNDPIVAYSLFFAVIMVMTGSTMLVEFTSVLFDENENYILLSRPVSSRTLLVTRLAHIMTYISIITFSLSIPVSGFVVIKHGISAIPFLVSVFLASWFTLMIVVGFYMSMAKLVNGERFKDIINYIQIGLTIVIIGGYQILPRIFDIEGIGEITLSMTWWTYLIPPVWFAGLADLFRSGLDINNVILSILALLVSIVGAVVLIRLLSNDFDTVLSQNSVFSGKKEKIKNVEGKRSGYLKWWSNIVCVSHMEKKGWEFANNVTKRDRKFKQQAYPSIAYAIIIAVVMLIPSMKNMDNFWVELASSQKYLGLIFVGVVSIVTVSLLSFSNTPQASWIYNIPEIKNVNHLHSGALKLLIFKFFVPVYFFLSMLVFYIWGVKEVVYILIGASANLLWAVAGITIQKQPLPFSVHYDSMKKGGYTARMIFTMIITGAIIGIVFGLTYLPFFVSLVALFIIMSLIPFSYSKIRNRKKLPSVVT
ncbi:hypothetical protein [Carboxylicivirga caseinilyticus]|uniref:hypothetical protein n=1 Tax=Carboxylicivirga caseinilyticus TaxID=3417572 RepID=UPI003D3342AB|nr:hypothetical protein [Marinilabiliaceae bacterium A049]